MEIRVRRLTPPRQDRVLEGAEVEIELDGHSIAIADIRILPGKDGGKPWVALPSFAVKDDYASYHYEPTVKLGPELRIAVENAVLAAHERGSSREPGDRPRLKVYTGEEVWAMEMPKPEHRRYEARGRR